MDWSVGEPNAGISWRAGDANLEKLIEGSCAFPFSLTGEPTSRISQSLQRGEKEGKMRRLVDVSSLS